jgi:hypothetical protein
MISVLYFTVDLLELFWSIACKLYFLFETCKFQPENAKAFISIRIQQKIIVFPTIEAKPDPPLMATRRPLDLESGHAESTAIASNKALLLHQTTEESMDRAIHTLGVLNVLMEAVVNDVLLFILPFVLLSLLISHYRTPQLWCTFLIHPEIVLLISIITAPRKLGSPFAITLTCTK